MDPRGAPRRAPDPVASSIEALLGPTNTGKTHRATQRMLEHESGIMGLPLRLLAREVYDRVSAAIGEAQVALVTGEEKRIPRAPRYWICTVEAMPTDLEVDFLAVDEIQLIAHPERGHVFTDRLLRARGRVETWFLGAETARGLVAELAPAAKPRSHPRLSRLGWAGTATLSTLPPRSAVVAFGMNKVYELAERLRQRRGGAAVVLGALSPRARNAQVAMYQAGEVDYLVATDAIGMGLNLEVDHVAFAELEKFDGRERRSLEPAELSQIAGRAGRFVRDGTFGVLEPARPLPEPVARAIEDHRFPALRRAYWRNAELDLTDLDGLLASLRAPPPRGTLIRVPRSDDTSALEALARDPEVRAAARGADRVALLWETCRIPDYRQLLSELHHVLVREIFLSLARGGGALTDDYLAAEVGKLDDTQGDIEDLLARMAQVRTWTYVTSHPGWVRDARGWEERTRALEDRLSDALHERLVQRFVDRGRAGRKSGVARARPGPARRAAQAGGARPDEPLAPSGPFAKLMTLRRTLASREGPGAAPPRALDLDVERVVAAPHEAFDVDPLGQIRFEGQPVGRLVRGRELTLPEARALVGEGGAALRVGRRLTAFARDLVAALLSTTRAMDLRARSAAARGLVWQLERSLGSLPRARAEEQLALLDEADREALAAGGVDVGAVSIVAEGALSATALARRATLVSSFHGVPAAALPPPGATSARPGSLPPIAWEAAGFVILGPRAVRADVAERARARAVAGAEVAASLGARPRDEEALRAALGLAQRPPSADGDEAGGTTDEGA